MTVSRDERRPWAVGEAPTVGSLGTLGCVNITAERGPSDGSSIRSSVLGVGRNVRLLAVVALQHLLDDPGLLVLQISRRMPLPARKYAGYALQRVGNAIRDGAAIAALGAIISGDTQRAQRLLEGSQGRASRLHAEVAVVAGRAELASGRSPASTRARAAWSQGDLSGAVSILEEADRASTAQARRLRSELRLLKEGFRLQSQKRIGGLREPVTEERLRILHFLTNSLPHTQSGYALRTHHILTGLRQQGIESLALTRTGYPVLVGKPLCADEDTIDGIRYRRTLPRRLGSTPEERLQQEADEALRIVSEFRPHVLHATTDYRNALVAQAVSAATGIPWVFEVRGLMEQTWVASHRSEGSRAAAAHSEKVALIQAAERRLALSADAVVTLSRTMADVLEARGIPEDRITLVPNGVDMALLAEDLSPAQARGQLETGLGPAEIAVGAVSALVDYEGHDVLLRAVSLVLHDANVPIALRDRLRVVLVGDGVSAPALATLTKELGIEERVLMPGRVPRNAAKLWVQALDVVVVPRKDLDVSRAVTPQKPAEALALGRPVVVSDLPALRETVTGPDGELLGVLVSPDSPEELACALVELLSDEDRRRLLATRGREAAASRTWPAMIGRYEVAYRAVLMTASEETTRGE